MLFIMDFHAKKNPIRSCRSRWGLFVSAYCPCTSGCQATCTDNRLLPVLCNDDDRRQRRKQGGAVGAAASRMQATAQQTLGAATRAVARRRRDGEVWFTMASRTKSKKRQIPKIPSKPIETFFERRVMDFPPSTAQIGYNSRRRGTGIGRAGRGGGTRETEAADLPSAPSRTSLCPAGGTFWRKRSAEHRYDPTRIY